MYIVEYLDKAGRGLTGKIVLVQLQYLDKTVDTGDDNARRCSVSNLCVYSPAGGRGYNSQTTQEEDSKQRNTLHHSNVKFPYVVYWHYQDHNIGDDIRYRIADECTPHVPAMSGE